MATVNAFPVPTNNGPSVINRQVEIPPDYAKIVYEYEDGGGEINVTPCGPYRIALDYEGLTETEAALLDTHFNLAKDRANDFSFFDARTGKTYTGVKYESYEVPTHQKYDIQTRRIVLIVEE